MGTSYYWYQNDHLGTPQKMVDTNGRIVWSATYDAFGNIHITIAEIENDLRFPGQYYDGETGLHYNFIRYYDPSTGRYVTRDPIGLAGGDVNSYRYVGNNPLKIIDPFVLWPRPAHERMIDLRFPTLDPRLADAIKRGSAYADSFKFQTPEYAYMHAMRSYYDQPISEAQKRTEEFIELFLKMYKCEIGRGNLEDAFFFLGMALHPVMDSNSPSHKGYQVAYYGFNYYHSLAESSPSDREYAEGVNNINQILLKYNISLE